MRYKLSRAANFIDKYGLFKGLQLYIQFKFKQVATIKIPQIKFPVNLRKNTSDTAVFDQVFLLDEYNINFNFSPKVIIDAGANIGLFSIVMANRFADATIICIEPGEDNYALLQKNTSSYNNIQTINAALWNNSGKLTVSDKYNMGQSALVVEKADGNGTTNAITINELMDQHNINQIDILKIDIETSEAILFADTYEVWLPKIKLIIIELHDWIKDDCSKPFFEAINKTWSKYAYSVCGENTVIENKGLI